MTGLVRKATMLVACGVLLGATVAMAGVPSPGNSTPFTRINVVGFDGGTNLPDSLALNAKVTVVVRDLGGSPINHSSVVIDFSGCLSDLRICTTQQYQGVTAVPDPAIIPVATRTGVKAFTNASGVATFVVVGGGIAGGLAHASNCVKVYADGVLLNGAGVGVDIYDLDGTGGVGLSDLSLWASDYFGGSNPDRSDYDGVGGVGLSDLGVWATTYFAGLSNSSCVAY